MKINDIHQGFLIVINGLFLAFLDFFSFLYEISCTFVQEYQKPHFMYFFSYLLHISSLIDALTAVQPDDIFRLAKKFYFTPLHWQ